MTSGELTVLLEDSLFDAFRARYFEIEELVEKALPADRDRNLETLGKVLPNVRSRVPVPQWDAALCQRFVLMACKVWRATAGSMAASDPLVVRSLRDLAEVTYGVARSGAALLPEPAKQKVCSIWASARLLDEPKIEDPAAFVQLTVTSLLPLGLSSDQTQDRVRLQVVFFGARHGLEALGSGADIVRIWCSELLTKPAHREHLVNAMVPGKLGVDVPSLGLGPQAGPEPMTAPANPSGPSLWPSPQLFDEERRRAEYRECLFELRALANDSAGCFSQRTADRVRTLRPDSTFDIFGPGLFFAIQDLWADFANTGAIRSLELVRRLSCLLLALETEDYKRAGVLSFWMSTLVPQLLWTCTLPDLMQDAAKLGQRLGIDLRDYHLRPGVVEALAGEHRRLLGAGDAVSAKALLDENSDPVGRMHHAYVEQSNQFRRIARPVEQAAWDYLVTQMPSRSVATSQDAVPTTPETTGLLNDSTFGEVIRRGSHEGVYEFVASRLSDVQGMLVRRLDIRLLPEHLLLPEGVVYAQRGATSAQIDPDFATAKQFLDEGKFDAASKILDRLSKGLHDRPLEICRAYQAYALAKGGELLLAQDLLIDLNKSRLTFPSGYWNLACCIPSEQMERQLQALADGLEYAPHTRILHGAVFLGLLLNNPNVSRWLTWLPFAEALLLAYYHQYERLTPEERNQALIRLNRCVKDGEAKDPDPTGSKIPVSNASTFLNDLIQRQQPEAAEFWLRCREGIGRKNIGYWRLKVDFLDQTLQRDRAAEAFREELRYRLDALRVKKFILQNSPREVRERAETWLRACKTTKLRPTGEAIFKMMEDFDASQSDSARKISVATRDGQIRRFFEKPLPPIDPPPLVDGTPPPPQSVLSVLAPAGATLARELHELSDLPRVHAAFERLLAGLVENGRRNTERALRRLLDAWRQQSSATAAPAGRAEREASLHAAQGVYSEFRGALRQEFSADELGAATALLQSLERVNSRLARSLDLLPELSISAASEDPIQVDDEVDNAAFPVRVLSHSGSGVIRLIGARATLDDGVTELSLRDRLRDLVVELLPKASTLLTLQLPTGLRLGSTRQVRVELQYEFAGSPFVSPASSVHITPHPRPARSEWSPYIHSRALEPNEIETHFFGRAAEQETILEISDPSRQRVYYVEGIRRTGKSSLLNSIQYELERRQLPLIPFLASATKVEPDKPAGMVLFNILDLLVKDPRVSSAGLDAPTAQQCCENLAGAYEQFSRQVGEKLAGKRLLILFDDFQAYVEAARRAADGKLALAHGAAAFLELIRASASPTSSVLWLLAGHRARRQFRSLMGGVLLWADLKGIEIDFLRLDAVGKILTVPLERTAMRIPPETVERVHAHTAGHPQFVQQMGEEMFRRVMRERRYLMTPADADEAASDIALAEDKFADIWYPVDELSREQRSLTAALIEAVKTVGGRIDQARLVTGKQLSDQQRLAIDDLVARKILSSSESGIGFKARVLELWLRRVIPQMMTEVSGGSVAIFIDVANLTEGKGSAVLNNLNTSAGEAGVPGRFGLENVIDCIEDYARELSQAPAAARWVVNYPLKSAAVTVCSSKGYYVENIPRELMEKGSDDMVLAEKIWEVETRYPVVNHFVLVLGDKDYVIAINRLLKNGKTVHVVSRQQSRAFRYEYLAREFPARFTTVTLEELLEKRTRR